jgi:hypothetical protein
MTSEIFSTRWANKIDTHFDFLKFIILNHQNLMSNLYGHVIFFDYSVTKKVLFLTVDTTHMYS